MEKVEKIKYKNLIQILIGSLVSCIFSLIFFFIFALVLSNTDVKESAIPTVTIIISIISILIGSTISSKKLKRNGILNGACIGIIYISTLYILSSCLLVGFKINIYSVLMIIGATISGSIGGIFGVNINRK